MGILGFRKFIGKIVFPVLLKFLFGKQYLSKNKHGGEIEVCTHFLRWPALYSWILCILQWTVWKLFIFQSEVKYFQELLVCLFICFIHFISVVGSCLISFLSFNTFYKDFVNISDMCHLNITVHSYPWVNFPLLELVEWTGFCKFCLTVVTFLW